MQATRPYPFYPQTQVQETPKKELKRSRNEATSDLAAVVITQDLGQKKTKNRDVTPLHPPASKSKKPEKHPTLQGIKRTRSTDEEEIEDVGDVIRKMEKISLQTSEVVTKVGSSNGFITLFKKTLALEIDPKASIDMSDDEFIHLTTRSAHFTHLSVLQSKSLTDTGFIKALMGRTDMDSVQISHCPKVTDWTIHAIAEQCPNISKLCITKCTEVTDEGIYSVATKCKNLRGLNVEWCNNLTDKTLQALGQHSHELEEFTTAECNNYTLQGFYALIAGCPKLSKLELWNCTQVDDAWIDLLCRSNCPIRELDIDGCDKISAEAIKRLEARFAGISIS